MHGRRVRLARTCSLVLTFVSLSVPSSAHAQGGTEWFVGATAGLGNGIMSVAGSAASAGGLVAGAQLGLARAGGRTWYLEATRSFFDVPNSRREEAYRATGFLLRRSLGSVVVVSPGLGVERREWSGANPVEAADTGLALALSLGVPIRMGGGLSVIPEARWRVSSIEIEGRVSGMLLSVSATVLWASSGAPGEGT